VDEEGVGMLGQHHPIWYLRLQRELFTFLSEVYGPCS